MDNEENYDGILRKALAIEEIPDDFDPQKIPQTGEEYLHYVMYEAKQCKEWVTADINKEQFRDKQTSVVSEPTGLIVAPKTMLPSVEWQKRQVSDFSAFRLHIQKLKQQKPLQEPPPFNGESEQWRKKFSEEPKLSNLLGLSQRNLRKILEFQLEWLEETQEKETIPHAVGAWLYAVLSCLDTPLMPETCSTLREISRKCSQIRSFLPPDAKEEEYKSLNLFICLIARYFNNYDLIDTPNEL